MPPSPEAVEVVQHRARYAKHWLNPDGTRTAVFSTAPVHYQATTGGAWVNWVGQTSYDSDRNASINTKFSWLDAFYQ